jgi:hypothetical protein
MLDFAIRHKDDLQKENSAVMLNIDKNKYYVGSTWTPYEMPIDPNNWDYLQLVSLSPINGEVIGFLSANWGREIDSIKSLGLINYKDKCNVEFSKDIIRFFYYMMCDLNAYKINWSVMKGNPIEKMYDKYCIEMGGRIAGTFKRNARLLDMTYVDEKFYEIFREDFKKGLQTRAGKRLLKGAGIDPTKTMVLGVPM